MSEIKQQISERFEIPEEDVICMNCEEYIIRNDGSYFCNHWKLEDNVPEGFCSFWWPIGGDRNEP